jgi:glutamine amidotransferase
MLAIVASTRRTFQRCLVDAPVSLALLSRDHPDGWGVAVHSQAVGWVLHRSLTAAEYDPRFPVVAEIAGEVLIGHVRKRTVGSVSLANTHPFERSSWVFAHNGTVLRPEILQRLISPRRSAEIQGQTDSEILFAYLLTELDAAGATESPSPHASDCAIRFAVTRTLGLPGMGTCNFVLANAHSVYAYRAGRELYLLDRWESSMAMMTGSAPTSDRTLLISSAKITDEPWDPVPEHGLLYLRRGASPSWGYL